MEYRKKLNRTRAPAAAAAVAAAAMSVSPSRQLYLFGLSLLSSFHPSWCSRALHSEMFLGHFETRGITKYLLLIHVPRRLVQHMRQKSRILNFLPYVLDSSRDFRVKCRIQVWCAFFRTNCVDERNRKGQDGGCQETQARILSFGAFLRVETRSSFSHLPSVPRSRDGRCSCENVGPHQKLPLLPAHRLASADGGAKTPSWVFKLPTVRLPISGHAISYSSLRHVLALICA